MVNSMCVKIGEEWYQSIDDYFVQNEGEFKD